MAIEKETYVIGGPFKIRESGVTAPFQFAGLVSTIQQTIETNEITLPDTTTRRVVSTMPFRASLRSGCRSTSANSRPASWLPWCGETPLTFLLPPIPMKRTPQFREARSRSTSCRWRSPA